MQLKCVATRCVEFIQQRRSFKMYKLYQNYGPCIQDHIWYILLLRHLSIDFSPPKKLNKITLIKGEIRSYVLLPLCTIRCIHDPFVCMSICLKKNWHCSFQQKDISAINYWTIRIYSWAIRNWTKGANSYQIDVLCSL